MSNTQKWGWLVHDDPPQKSKGSIGKSTAMAVRDAVIGGFIGSHAGAAVGKFSLLLGVVVTGAGHYFGSSAISGFGIGMMGANGYKFDASGQNRQTQPVSGFNAKAELGNAKIRMGNFWDQFKEKFPLSIVFKGKTATTETGGEALSGPSAEEALRAWEAQDAMLMDKAMDFQQSQSLPAASYQEDMSGFEEEYTYSDVSLPDFA